MQGFFNQIGRNVASSTRGSEFEKRLAKATYSLDFGSEEPKEKHVLFVVECLSGEQSEIIQHEDAFAQFIDRFNKNTKNSVCVAKLYIILHRFLAYKKQYENTTSTEIACYQISTANLNNQVEEQKEIINAYHNYLQYYSQQNSSIKFINIDVEEAKEEIQELLLTQIFECFEIINVLLKKMTDILNLFLNDAKTLIKPDFNKKRLYHKMTELLLNDMHHTYRNQYLLVIELFFRMIKAATFEKDWYQQGYLLFEQFVINSGARGPVQMTSFIFQKQFGFQDPQIMYFEFIMGNRHLMEDLCKAVQQLTQDEKTISQDDRINVVTPVSRIYALFQRHQFSSD